MKITSLSQYEINDWQEITLELRSFKQYIENGGTVLDENFIKPLQKGRYKQKNLII
jgi:hypothetical protein